MSQPDSNLERIVDQSIQWHGGHASFAAIDQIQIRIRKLSGVIPKAKGIQRTFPHPGDVTLKPRANIAIFHELANDSFFSHEESSPRSLMRAELGATKAADSKNFFDPSISLIKIFS